MVVGSVAYLVCYPVFLSLNQLNRLPISDKSEKWTFNLGNSARNVAFRLFMYALVFMYNVYVDVRIWSFCITFWEPFDHGIKPIYKG